MRGTIVCSRAGRDKGDFMVVVGYKDDAALVCDGKHRPLERPKAKNPKHLAFTCSSLSEDSLLTNRSLRKALAAYRSRTEFKEEI